jgi:tRNA modification GTPase
MPGRQILERIAEIRAPMDELAHSFAYGKIVHEGLSLAIVGRPNVGKSSLFNRLVERERAIVTATPGTTRDLVSETVSLGGIPVRLTDTAGLRAANDEAETIGIRKSYEALAEADLVLLVTECSTNGASSREEDQRLLQVIGERPHLVVENKCDLDETGRAATISSLRTSALTGEGIEDLRGEILRCIGSENGAQQESGMLTNLRHQQLVRESIAGLEAAATAASNSIPHEMLLLDLYNALRALDSLTGATTTDDILTLIFSSFCIGK